MNARNCPCRGVNRAFFLPVPLTLLGPVAGGGSVLTFLSLTRLVTADVSRPNSLTQKSTMSRTSGTDAEVRPVPSLGLYRSA